MSEPVRLRKSYEVKCRSLGSPVAVFAPTASKARAQVIENVRDAWGCTFREALAEVGRVARAPWSDAILPSRHPLASQISAELLHCVVHAYGGTGFRAGYRDHFYTSADDLVLLGGLYNCLFRVLRRDKGRSGQPDMVMYELTDLGRNVARGEQKTYPHAGRT